MGKWIKFVSFIIVLYVEREIARYDVWYLTYYKFLLFFYPEISTVKSTSVNFIIINVSDDV